MHDQPQHLREWLENQQMTQAELARKVGLQYNYVATICRGEKPLSSGFRLRFIEQFGFDPETLNGNHTGANRPS